MVFGIEKKAIRKIGCLDEKFDFYYADNDYAMTLLKYNILHALVTKARAKHLEGQSTKTNKQPLKIDKRIPKYIISENRTWILENEKMIEGAIKFHDKWGPYKLLKFKVKLVLLLQKICLGSLNKLILFNYK